MSRWYRAYSGTVRDDKLAECSIIAGCSRSIVIATWHAILESAADAADGGRFETTPRRVAALLVEPAATIEAVFAAMAEVGLIGDGSVTAWKKRQYESDSSTERSRKHREAKRNADATLQGRSATAPDTDTDTDTDISSVPSDIERAQSAAPASPKKPKREKQQELDDEQILAELSPWLAREAASALIAHRRGLGCKHTAFSVGLLCRELAKCRDPTGQAEKAILSNWKSVYPEKDHAAGNGSGQGSAAAFGSFTSRDGRGSGGVVAAAQRVIAGFEREEHLSRQRNGDDREIAGFIVREGIG